MTNPLRRPLPEHREREELRVAGLERDVGLGEVCFLTFTCGLRRRAPVVAARGRGRGRGRPIRRARLVERVLPTRRRCGAILSVVGAPDELEVLDDDRDLAAPRAAGLVVPLVVLQPPL